MKSKKQRVLAISMVAIWVLAIIGWLQVDDVKYYFKHQADEAYVLGYEPEKDPRIGTVVQFPASVIPPRGTRTLLVVMGACNNCSMHKVSMDLVSRAKFAAIWFVFQDTRERLKTYLKYENGKVHIVADEKATLAKELNATFFSPRAFVIDADERIAKMQAPGQEVNGFVEDNS